MNLLSYIYIQINIVIYNNIYIIYGNVISIKILKLNFLCNLIKLLFPENSIINKVYTFCGILNGKYLRQVVLSGTPLKNFIIIIIK